MGWTDSVWQMCLQHNLSIIVQQQVQQMFSEVHFDNRQLLLMRPSRYKTKTMRLRLGDESYSAPSVHQTQQVRIAKGCCHHYKLETKHVSSSIFTNLAVFCSKGGGVSNPCSNIAKGTTDPRVEFIKVTSWGHITSWNTNLDQISSSESRPSINFKISTNYQQKMQNWSGIGSLTVCWTRLWYRMFRRLIDKSRKFFGVELILTQDDNNVIARPLNWLVTM